MMLVDADVRHLSMIFGVCFGTRMQNLVLLIFCIFKKEAAAEMTLAQMTGDRLVRGAAPERLHRAGASEPAILLIFLTVFLTVFLTSCSFLGFFPLVLFSVFSVLVRVCQIKCRL